MNCFSIPTGGRHRAVCAGMLFFLAALPGVTKGQGAKKLVGARLPAPQPFNFVRVPEAHKAAANAMAQKLYDIVRRDTMFYEPVAYDVQPSLRIDMPPRAGYTPIEYDLPGFLYALGDEVPATTPRTRTPTDAMYIYGNGLGHFFRITNKWQEDEKGVMYFEPPRQPDVAGFPAYGKGFVVVTRSERPLYLPVPRERAIRLVIATNKKGIEGVDPSQKALIDRTNACNTKLEQELSSLSAAERAEPTYLAMGRVPGRDGACDPFGSATDRNALRIIMENPNFYDTTLPPSAIQVVFVSLQSFNANVPEQRMRLEKVKSTLDFAALAALTARSSAASKN